MGILYRYFIRKEGAHPKSRPQLGYMGYTPAQVATCYTLSDKEDIETWKTLTSDCRTEFITTCVMLPTCAGGPPFKSIFDSEGCPVQASLGRGFFLD